MLFDNYIYLIPFVQLISIMAIDKYMAYNNVAKKTRLMKYRRRENNVNQSGTSKMVFT